MFDDDAPRQSRTHTVGMPLDTMSVDELEERIGLLEAEIVRLREAVAARRQTKSAAESVFKL